MAIPEARPAIEKLSGIPQNQEAINRLDRILAALRWMEELAGEEHGLTDAQLKEHQRLAQIMYDMSVYPRGVTSESAAEGAKAVTVKKLPGGLIEFEEV